MNKNTKNGTGTSSDPKKLTAFALETGLPMVATGWDLNVHELCDLLSTKPSDQVPEIFSAEQLARAGMLMLIFHFLHAIHPDPQTANRWVRTPNSEPPFNGNQPIHLMTADITGLIQVYRFIGDRVII